MNAIFTINRFNEQGAIPCRSDRFYQNNNEWFFSVRQTTDQGPFQSFADARSALTAYINMSLSSST